MTFLQWVSAENRLTIGQKGFEKVKNDGNNKHLASIQLSYLSK